MKSKTPITYNVPFNSYKSQKTITRHIKYGTKLFENKELRKIFGPNRNEVIGMEKTI
jgi:methyl coenzyme M reductase subunit D